MTSLFAAVIKDSDLLENKEENHAYYKRLSSTLLKDYTLVKGYKVYHNYRSQLKQHEFFVLDHEQYRVLYYCMLAASSERSIFKPSLHLYSERLVWRSKLLPKSFAKIAFAKCIFPKCKSYIVTDEEQSQYGFNYWYMLIYELIQKNYTVVLFAVDNKQNRKYCYLDKEADFEFRYDLGNYLMGKDNKYRHRGMLISVKKEVINPSVNAKEVDQYEFLDEEE